MSEVTPRQLGAFTGARTASRPMSLDARLAVLLASFFINVLALAAPMTALLIYDRVLLNDSHATLWILVAGAATLILFEAMLRLSRATIISRASAHADFAARNRVIERILDQPVRPGQRVSSSMMTGRLSAVGASRELRFARLIALIDLPFGLAFLLLVGVIGGWAVALPAGVCIIFLMATGGVALANGRALGRMQRADRDLGNFAEAGMRSVHAIAATASQFSVINGFVHRQLVRSGTQKKQGFLDLLTRDLFISFSYLLIGSVIVAGAVTVLGGDLSLGGLAACTLLAGRSLEPFQSCFQLITLRQRAKVAHGDISELKRYVPAPTAARSWEGPPEVHIGDARIADASGSRGIVEVTDVTFPAGEVVTISGDRGAGKTSLCMALLGLAPVEGTIEVGGIDVAGPDAVFIRRQSGYLPRVPQLPAGRLIDALTNSSEELYADVRYLAHLIGLDEAVKRLPAGYDTVIQPDGSSYLPAGVCQQIAICRVLARKPKLLIADDATVALDAATEIRFANVVKMLAGEATIILMTDRSSLKSISAHRFELTGGQLVPALNLVEGSR